MQPVHLGRARGARERLEFHAARRGPAARGVLAVGAAAADRLGAQLGRGKPLIEAALVAAAAAVCAAPMGRRMVSTHPPGFQGEVDELGCSRQRSCWHFGVCKVGAELAGGACGWGWFGYQLLIQSHKIALSPKRICEMSTG